MAGRRTREKVTITVEKAGSLFTVKGPRGGVVGFRLTRTGRTFLTARMALRARRRRGG